MGSFRKAIRPGVGGQFRCGHTAQVTPASRNRALGGAAIALALPVDASPTALALAAPATTASAGRADDLSASRSAARARLASAPAVSAPVDAAPLAPEAVGVAGVKAVAKPKPKDRAFLEQVGPEFAKTIAGEVATLRTMIEGAAATKDEPPVPVSEDRFLTQPVRDR